MPKKSRKGPGLLGSLFILLFLVSLFYLLAVGFIVSFGGTVVPFWHNWGPLFQYRPFA